MKSIAVAFLGFGLIFSYQRSAHADEQPAVVHAELGRVSWSHAGSPGAGRGARRRVEAPELQHIGNGQVLPASAEFGLAFKLEQRFSGNEVVLEPARPARSDDPQVQGSQRESEVACKEYRNQVIEELQRKAIPYRVAKDCLVGGVNYGGKVLVGILTFGRRANLGRWRYRGTARLEILFGR